MKVKSESNECTTEGKKPSNLTSPASSTTLTIPTTNTHSTTGGPASAEIGNYGSFNYPYQINANPPHANNNGNTSMQTSSPLGGFMGLPYWPMSGSSTAGSGSSTEVPRYEHYSTTAYYQAQPQAALYAESNRSTFSPMFLPQQMNPGYYGHAIPQAPQVMPPAKFSKAGAKRKSNENSSAGSGSLNPSPSRQRKSRLLFTALLYFCSSLIIYLKSLF